ncbi:MAG: nuclear transport factor 2 family protein [Sphingomonas sp.]
MRRMLIGLFGVMILASPGAASARDSSIAATIQRFDDAFNKGDMAGAAATMTDDVTIIDEFAPFNWQGRGAFANWSAGYDKDAKAKGITDPVVRIAPSTREIVSLTSAYVVTPAVYTFKQKGIAMSETAQMTFSLEKGAGGWKITGWTWTGPDPAPAR